mmetsp:Transcript_6741/g.12797  ORF Transcript_6741/g.12797 Transcript_6741/m.12797 type:complete len:114 (-) Transcript_6741:279-620(-)
MGRPTGSPQTCNGWQRLSKSQPFTYVCGPEPSDDFDVKKLHVAGIILIIFALLIFLLGTYSLVVSKLLPSTGIWLLDCIREDMYFCLLVPMLIPVTLMKVYCSWVSMKFFKHA